MVVRVGNMKVMDRPDVARHGAQAAPLPARRSSGTAAEEATTSSRADSDFEAFYRAELRPLTALAASMTGNYETGKDVAHEALLRAYRGWEQVRLLDRPGLWVRRVTVNLAIDVQRRRATERVAVARLAGRQPLVTDPSTDGEPADATYWRLVRQLPEHQQMIVTLRYVDDMPQHLIAATLGIPEGTVKSQLSRARRTLAAALAKEHRR